MILQASNMYACAYVSMYGPWYLKGSILSLLFLDNQFPAHAVTLINTSLRLQLGL